MENFRKEVKDELDVVHSKVMDFVTDELPPDTSLYVLAFALAGCARSILEVATEKDPKAAGAVSAVARACGIAILSFDKAHPLDTVVH